MNYHKNVLELIGQTPMVRLNRMVDRSMATVLAKLEFLNPGGSVKDRMAVHMIREAEKKGLLRPGGVIVESTSGNTGMGLTIAAAALGYRCICTLPDKMSQEKIDTLKACGAEVIVTPTDVPHDAPESYVEVARRIARETPNAYYTDQYHNMANPEAHYHSTGPEIWADTDGLIDCFVAGIGTGGTVSGAGRFLKEQAKRAGRKVSVVCPDPIGSIYHDAWKGRSEQDWKSHVYAVEGIGHDFMVGTLDLTVIDEVMPVSDKDSFIAARRLAREEGIFAGGSTGTAVHGALEVARRLGPGKTVVVIICDTGSRYISKLFNDEWMKDNGYLDHDDRMGYVRDVLQFKGGRIEVARENDEISTVIDRMAELGISQMPVVPGNGTPPDAAGGFRMIHEVDLLHSLVKGRCKPTDPVKHCAALLQGEVSPGDPLSKVQQILDTNNVAVVIDLGEIIGIVSKIDVVRFLASRS